MVTTPASPEPVLEPVCPYMSKLVEEVLAKMALC
jgi:hypothetical protein